MMKAGESKRPETKRPKPKRSKVTAGWIENVDLPDLRVFNLRAKLDTGAKSSALHVEHMVPLGNGRIRFDVVLESPGKQRVRHVEARISRRGRVRSSNGEYSMRYFISTRMRLGDVEREVEISLVDRERMLYRMLVGRTSLTGMLVDPTRRHLLDAAPAR